MVRIAVCDDNPPVAEQIRQIWETKAGEFWKEIRTEVFYDAESLIRADREEAFDIYVLDICMPGMDGFQAAEKIRNRGGGRYLIFITSQDELVYQVFPYEPFAFFRKRTPELISRDMEETMKRLCARFVQEEILILEGAYHIKEQVRIGEIRYLWSQKNYLLYMLISNRQVRIRKTMEKAQEELRGKGFLRIHKSLLVNMGHLVQIDYKRNCVEMTGGEWLEIGISYRKQIGGQYLDYIRGGTLS